MISCLILPLALSWPWYWTVAPRPGDNLETDTYYVLYHAFWDERSLPVRWMLHEDGVIDNDTTGTGAPPVSNAAALAQLQAAVAPWEDDPRSDVTFEYADETSVTDSLCDGKNVVLWTDSLDDWGTGWIALASIFQYDGKELTLDATNRALPCGEGATLDVPDVFENGTTLRTGTILDMDLIWNAVESDFATTPNTKFGQADIAAVAVHEFGHGIGLSHSSLGYTSDPPTMYPLSSTEDAGLQEMSRAPNPDDLASLGLTYPATGFWPGGQGPFTTGAIAGSVLESNGAAVAGARVWAFPASDTSHPEYETFTATPWDWDESLAAGDYVLGGLTPGDYYVAILPWYNRIPALRTDQPGRYNSTTTYGFGYLDFRTELFDDVQTPSKFPDPDSVLDSLEKVTVTAGETTEGIDFVTEAQKADVVFVMDRSGSMKFDSATPGLSKIQAAQFATNAFVDYMDLNEGHRLGLVQFESDVVPFDPVFVLSELDLDLQADAKAALSDIIADGSTNIVAGVDEGLEQLTSGPAENRRQILVLLTDGRHNHPPGSELGVISQMIVDNDVSLFSLGLGTDVNTETLSMVALETNGFHLEEQEVGLLELIKTLLWFAASAADDGAIVDPRIRLAAGETKSVEAHASSDERALTFAVAWQDPGADRFGITLTSPGGCRIPTDDSFPGVSVRKGATHRIVRVPLPYDCNGAPDVQGTWTVSVTAVGVPVGTSEDVEVLVYTSSRLRLFARTFETAEGPYLNARMVRRGHPVTGPTITATVVTPLPSTHDSELQDTWRDPATWVAAPSGPPEELRTHEIVLLDDGAHQDGAADDGLFGAALPLGEPGSHFIHLRAELATEAERTTRELVTSYLFAGYGQPGASPPVSPQSKDRSSSPRPWR